MQVPTSHLPYLLKQHTPPQALILIASPCELIPLYQDYFIVLPWRSNYSVDILCCATNMLTIIYLLDGVALYLSML